MKKAERQDLQKVREKVREDRDLLRSMKSELDLSPLDEDTRRRVETIMVIATSGMLLTSIDLGDILAGRGRQDD